jgi:hypothetical protein
MQIDDLRKERIVFKEINKKLQFELGKKKELMEKELKEAEEVYIKKEEMKKKLKMLKVESETKNKEQKDELRKLWKLIE